MTTTHPPTGRPPNIVVVFADQQRWDTCGAHGNPLGLTPNFDALCRRGAWLTHCFTPQPLCGPARACIQTGMYATRAGVHINGLTLPREHRTLAKCFADAGYRTGYFGKWHLAGRDNPDGPVPADRRGGYQRWMAADRMELVSDAYDCVLFDEAGEPCRLPGYRTDAVTDAAIRFLDEAAEQPFLCFVSLVEPHQQNSRDDFPAPLAYRDLYRDAWLPPDLADADDDQRDKLAGYLGMVRRVDEALGRVLDALESLNLTDDTIVLFTSDHGCHFKSRNGEYKRSCHEASIRVPGVIAGPGFDGKGPIDAFVSLIDLPPTLIAGAGLPVPDAMQGRPLGDRLSKMRGTAEDEAVYVQISESQCGRALRTHRWRYAVEAPPSVDPKAACSATYHEAFLYDLESDPAERNNLVDEPAYETLRATLATRLGQLMQEAGEPSATIRPALSPTALAAEATP